MTAIKARVLVVEDDEAMASMLRDALAMRGYEVATASGPAKALQLLGAGTPFDVLVTDVRLGSADGLDMIEKLQADAKREGRAPMAVIVITAFGTVETAVRAFHAGASDYLTKPFELEALGLSIERVLEVRRLKGEIHRLRRESGWKRRRDVIGASEAMRQVLELVERAADTDATVLVTGPSGTGKEVIARLLHERSRRAEGPFVAVNCAAIPEQLLESELFGHRKGAFTDARANKDGLFRRADGGTLLLDELGEMPLTLQPKLLRVLQEREFTAVGANEPESVDVRVVAATNQDLEQLVETRKFREDLYYRLNVIRVELPPLAARPEDIVPLAESFLARLAGQRGRTFTLSPEAVQALTNYRWPGNVRELENAMERASALARTTVIGVDDLPATLARPRPSLLIETAVQRGLSLDQFSNEYCQAVVRFHAGNQSRAAKHLDIDRKTLAKRLAAAAGEAAPSADSDD